MSTDLSSIESSLDRSKDAFKARVGAIVDRQVQTMTGVARKVVQQGKTVEPEKIQVPMKTELKELIFKSFIEFFEIGRASVQMSARRQLQKLALPVWAMNVEMIEKVFGAKAASAAGFLNTKLQAQFAFQMLRGFDEGGTFDTDAISSMVRAALLKDVNVLAGTAVMDPFNIGRGVEGRRLGAEQAQYSAILDKNTCEPCRQLDGKMFKVGSASYDQNFPPLSKCLGGDNCRCIYVYDFTDLVKPLDDTIVTVPPSQQTPPIENPFLLAFDVDTGKELSDIEFELLQIWSTPMDELPLLDPDEEYNAAELFGPDPGPHVTLSQGPPDVAGDDPEYLAWVEKLHASHNQQSHGRGGSAQLVAMKHPKASDASQNAKAYEVHHQGKKIGSVHESLGYDGNPTAWAWNVDGSDHVFKTRTAAIDHTLKVNKATVEIAAMHPNSHPVALDAAKNAKIYAVKVDGHNSNVAVYETTAGTGKWHWETTPGTPGTGKQFKSRTEAVAYVKADHIGGHIGKNSGHVKPPTTTVMGSQTKNADLPGPQKVKNKAYEDDAHYVGAVQVGGQKGSNPGGVYQTKDGSQYYVKFPKSEEHAISEVAAQSVYAGIGLQVTGSSHVVVNGTGAVAAPWHSGNKQLTGQELNKKLLANPDEAGKLMVAAAITQNWDHVGTGYDNLVVTKDGKLMVVDTGGSFLFRAQGGHKPYTTDAKEMSSLMNSSVNSYSATAFKGVTSDKQALASMHAAAKHYEENAHYYAGGGKIPGVSEAQFKAKATSIKLHVEGLQAIHAPVATGPIKPANIVGSKITYHGDPLQIAPQHTIGKVSVHDEVLYDSVGGKVSSHAASLSHKSYTPWKSQLSQQEMSAVKDYTGSAYGPMNNILRGKSKPTDYPGYLTSVKNATSALHKASFPHDVELSHKAKFSPEEFQQAYGFPLNSSLVGSTITQRGFTSASINPGTWSGSVRFVLEVPAGAKAAYVRPLSAHKDEYEVIIQRGAQYKILDVKPDGYGHQIRARLVGHDLGDTPAAQHLSLETFDPDDPPEETEGEIGVEPDDSDLPEMPDDDGKMWTVGDFEVS